MGSVTKGVNACGLLSRSGLNGPESLLVGACSKVSCGFSIAWALRPRAIFEGLAAFAGAIYKVSNLTWAGGKTI